MPCLSALSSRPPVRPPRASCAWRAETAKISGRLAQKPGGVVPNVADDLVALFRPGQDVDLVDDEDDLLAPLTDLLQEPPLALGEGSVGRGDEQDQIGAGNEVAGQLLVTPNDRVGARRVHDVELAEDLGRVGALQQVRLPELLRHLGAVAENVDPVGGGRDALGQDPLAEQGVDEAGLAGVELAGDHQKKETGELLPGLLKSAQVVGGDVGAEALEGGGQALEQLLLADANLLLPLGQDAPAGQQLADHFEPPGWSSTAAGVAVPALPSYLVASIGAYPGCRSSTVIRRAGAVAGPLFHCCRSITDVPWQRYPA